MVRDQSHREIADDKGMGKGCESQSSQNKLHKGCRYGHRHPVAPAFLSTDHRNHHLHDGNYKGEDQGEMSKF